MFISFWKGMVVTTARLSKDGIFSVMGGPNAGKTGKVCKIWSVSKSSQFRHKQSSENLKHLHIYSNVDIFSSYHYLIWIDISLC